MGLARIFTIKGRVSRGSFWASTLAAWVVFYALTALLAVQSGSALVWVVNLPVLAFLVMLCARRLHDRNFSGWWLLAVIVPVAGAAWLVWQLALRRGVPQDNRWGLDPLAARGDYLVVQ